MASVNNWCPLKILHVKLMESNKFFVLKAKLFIKKGIHIKTVNFYFSENFWQHVISKILKISKNDQKISKNIAQEFTVTKISFI